MKAELKSFLDLVTRSCKVKTAALVSLFPLALATGILSAQDLPCVVVYFHNTFVAGDAPIIAAAEPAYQPWCPTVTGNPDSAQLQTIPLELVYDRLYENGVWKQMVAVKTDLTVFGGPGGKAQPLPPLQPSTNLPWGSYRLSVRNANTVIGEYYFDWGAKTIVQQFAGTTYSFAQGVSLEQPEPVIPLVSFKQSGIMINGISYVPGYLPGAHIATGYVFQHHTAQYGLYAANQTPIWTEKYPVTITAVTHLPGDNPNSPPGSWLRIEGIPKGNAFVLGPPIYLAAAWDGPRYHAGVMYSASDPIQLFTSFQPQ